MSNAFKILLMVSMVWLMPTGPLQAGLPTRAASEIVELFAARGAVKGARAMTLLAEKIEALAVRHGEGALVAIRKAGPAAVELIEAAGPNASQAIRVLAEWGELGASRVLTRPAALRQFIQHGEQAAAVLVKHPGVAESLLERGGAAAVHALEGVSAQNGRRLAMLMEGELAAAGRHPELFNVVARHGDAGVNFLWKHKELLAGGAALTVFLANPEPFLNGARDLAQVASDGVVKPVLSLLTTALVILGGLIAVVVVAVCKFGLPHPERIIQLIHLGGWLK